MAKGKRGPALIELIHRQDTEGIRQPTWFSGRAETADSRPALAPDASVNHPVPPPATAVDGPSTWVSVRGERVIFSFSSVSAGVVVFLLIVALGGSFLIGRRAGEDRGLRAGFREGVASVRAGAMGEIESAKRSDPNTDIFEGVGTSPVAAIGEPEAPVEALPPADSASQAPGLSNSPWVQGHTYIVVQEFKAGDQSDADAAQLFLHDHGVETAVLESGGNYKYRLVATKGFNREAPAQRAWCDEYHARIKELGRLFVKAGGRYDLQGYRKKLTGPSW